MAFDAELARLRFWNRLGIAALVCGLPLLVVLTVFARFIPFAPVLAGLVFVAMAVMLLTARIKIWVFRCPACGQPFNRKHAMAPQGRGRQCVHCGLKAYKD